MHPVQCVCCQAKAVGGDPDLAWYSTIDEHVKKYGWAVQGGMGDDEGFLHTVGLTTAGLPELVTYDIPRAKVETVHALLNAFARQHCKLEFHPGQTRQLSNVTIAVSENTRREKLGACNLYYGKGQYRTLCVTFLELDSLMG